MVGARQVDRPLVAIERAWAASVLLPCSTVRLHTIFARQPHAACLAAHSTDIAATRCPRVALVRRGAFLLNAGRARLLTRRPCKPVPAAARADGAITGLGAGTGVDTRCAGHEGCDGSGGYGAPPPTLPHIPKVCEVWRRIKQGPCARSGPPLALFSGGFSTACCEASCAFLAPFFSPCLSLSPCDLATLATGCRLQGRLQVIYYILYICQCTITIIR